MSGPPPRKNIFDDPFFEEQTLSEKPTSLVERFWANAAGDLYRGTPEGAASLALNPSIDPETGILDVERSRARDRLVAYDNMASSETLLEYAFAAAGGLYGQAMAPSSYVSAPIKWGSQFVKGIGGRILDAAIGNAMVSTALDVPTQLLSIASGQQEEYSATQTALAPVAGALFGAAGQGTAELFGRALTGSVTDPVPEGAPESAVPDAVTPTATEEAALPAETATARADAAVTPTDPVDAATPAAEAQPPITTPEAPAAEAVTAEPAHTAPKVEVDRERWGDDGDEVADLARATAEGIEGKAELPELLAVERAGAPSRPDTPAAPDGAKSPDLDFITGQQKALATRTTMRGEVTAAPGKRIGKGAAPEPVRARREILGDLVTAFDATVRQGVSGKGTKDALGVFNRKTGAVRTRNLDDASVVAHELGHDLHMRVIGKPLDDLVNRHANELRFLDYDPTKMRPHEGFAEWMRIWSTNPNAAAKPAPNFTREVFTLLDKDYPKLAKALRSYQSDMMAYLNAPSAVRQAADVAKYAKPEGWEKLAKNVKTKGLFQTIGGYFSTFYRATFDDKNFLRIGVRELLRVAQENHFKATGQKTTFDLKAADDAYKLKRNMSDIKSVGMMDLLHGVRGYKELKASTRSLSEGLAVATGQPSVLGKWNQDAVRDLDAYLIALRGKWLYEEKFAKGVIDRPPTAATLGDHIATIKDLEKRYPGFREGAKIIHEWARGMLKKRFDAGLISKEQYADALSETAYVPFQRDMSNLVGDELGGAGAGMGRALERSDVKRLRGSDRPIISPVQSLIQQAFRVNLAIRQNEVVRALDRLANMAGPGAAAIAERIPNSQMKAMRLDPIDAVRDAARRQGLDEMDIADLVDDLQAAIGEDAMGVLFGSKPITPGGKPILFFWDGGERKALQLADGDFGKEMFQAIMGMPPGLGDMFTQVMSLATTPYRLAITTNPAFLGANFIRDQLSAWVLTDGFIPFWDGFRGMGNELLQGDLAKAYNTSGGISGGAMTAETLNASATADINALARKGWLIQRGTSLSGILSVTELAETGTRLAVFDRAFKSSKTQGLSDYEALIEASYISRDYIDFGRRGSNMVAASRIIPFLNASLQGLDKTTRAMIAPAVRYMRGDVLTKQELKELGSSMKAWAKVGVLTTFGLGLALVNVGNESWQDAPANLRASHWLVHLPGDRWFAIPKPFELALPSTIGERLVQYFETNDPRQIEYLRDDIFSTLLPPDVMDNPIIKSLSAATTGVDSFTGRDVVPDYLKGFEPWLQYSASTSFFARDLGEATGMSPLYIDHIINGFLPSWGRDVTSLYDAATGRRTSLGWDDMVFTRRFIKDLSRGNTASQVFWDQIGQSTGRFVAVERTFERMATGQIDGDAQSFLAKQDPEIRAYVALRQDAFDADDRRMHPLTRAQDLIGVLGTLRREMSDDKQKSAADGQPIPMSPDKRRMADDVLAKLAYGEARNALVVAGDPGYRNRALIDLSGDYQTLYEISPDLSAEFADRLATAKVADFAAVAEVWPEAQARLVQDGTQARLNDLRAQVRMAGYEGGGRKRRIRAEKIEVLPAEAIQ